MMQMIIFLFAIIGIAAATGDVIIFTDDNFHSDIGDHDVILIEFYAPWCGHCKKLEPEYNEAATRLKRNNPPISIAKVDCIDNKDTCSEFGVSGYPTLKIFRNGEFSADYQGARNADGIVSYMKKQAAPVLNELKTLQDVDDYLKNMDNSIVGFFTGDNSDKSEFSKTANKMFENHRFAYTTAEDALKKYEYSDQVVLFRPSRLHSKFEDNKVLYDGPIKAAKLQSFVKDNSVGLCGHLTNDNKDLFKKPLLIAYYDVDYDKNMKGTNYWRNRVMKIAKKHTDQTLYYAVADKTEFSSLLGEFGFEDTTSELPLVAIEGANGEKFKMDADFARDGSTLDAFVTDFLDDKLEAYLKSEPIPEDDGPVKVAVAKNFNELVMDETKDVLIEFYAPWCGHCKKLTPIYEELATKLAGDENIVIAKMDATANDVPPQFEVRGFPTLYWAPMNGKSNPKKYEGGREVDDFLAYVKREATNKPVKVDQQKTEL